MLTCLAQPNSVMKGLTSHCKTFKRRKNDKTKPGPERESQKKENCDDL